MVEKYRDKETNIIYEKMLPVTHERAFYEGFKQETIIIPKGYQTEEGALPFACDTVYERDVPIRLRDGIIIYADVYRPLVDVPVPAIMSCCWAGKSARHDMWGAALYPGQNSPIHSMVSGRQLWLGLDPARWTAYGYAIVSVDSRGVYMSEGNVRFPSCAEGRDGYDVIEWIAQQPWSNKKVAMAGQRWTGEMQWFTAAQCPPHLVCFAPWDAHGNLYMEEFVRGGIPKARGTTLDRSFGRNYIEAIDDMVCDQPLYSDYWKDKTVDYEKITVPAFLVGNYNSKYHTRGNIEGFRRISSKKKWLKLCDFDGYKDFYSDENMLELKQFMDCFMKGEKNGWENTSRVRMLVMDFGGEDIKNREEKEFPLQRQQPLSLFLNASDMSMKTEIPAYESQRSYNSEHKEEKIFFVYEFDSETELSGFSKLKLWLSTDSNNDMDIFVEMGKMDGAGNRLNHNNYFGPNSKLRISHRAIDTEKSTEFEPVHLHNKEELLLPGQIVSAEFDIWPTSMIFHPGEKLYISVSGYGDTGMPPVYEPGWKDTELHNKGNHYIYTGGHFDSKLVIPIVNRNI